MIERDKKVDDLEAAIERIRTRAISITKDFCDVANEARPAGIVVQINNYIDPDGVYRPAEPRIFLAVPRNSVA